MSAGFDFVPTPGQASGSNVYRFMRRHGIGSVERLRERAAADPAWFWGAVGDDVGVVWDGPYSEVLDTSAGAAWPRWFVGGRTNIARSSLERHAAAAPGRVAYHFVSESGAASAVTYAELESEASMLANGLRSAGIGRGDVVGIFMPMMREAVAAIFACAKIGAVQTVIFSGYGPDALRVRLRESGARLLVTCDGFWRRGRAVSQKGAVLGALGDTQVERVVVARYGGVDGGYDYDGGVFVPYDRMVSGQPADCPAEPMDSDDPLFILYTSGTTGRPKGVVHAHGGFSVFAGHQAAYLLDLGASDVLFWPADIGWITGLVWNVYGLAMTGATAVLYDGALDYPDSSAVWRLLERYGVTVFGTSPTAVRMFRRSGVDPRSVARLGGIRNIAATGEPMDADSWDWLLERVGGGRIPVTNLSGGTEIGGAMLSVLPGMSLRRSTVGMPCPGMDLDVVDDDGMPVHNRRGYLVIRSPWPAMTRGLLNDPDGYIRTYWSRFPGVWFHGDYVLRDSDGLWYMLGRVDDVINVSGHRLGTAEIEQAASSHPAVSEAASVSIPDEITGEAIVVFAVLREGRRLPASGTAAEISGLVSERVGRVARPKHVCIVADLPRTRTGKIMRRLLRARCAGEPPGDLSSLENPGALDGIPRLG